MTTLRKWLSGFGGAVFLGLLMVGVWLLATLVFDIPEGWPRLLLVLGTVGVWAGSLIWANSGPKNPPTSTPLIVTSTYA